MKRTLVILFLILGVNNTFAKKNCTKLPREKWMNEKEFKTMVIEQGYKIRKFKQPGSCYEIYGRNKDGREVEIYFNPVDGSIKKIKFED